MSDDRVNIWPDPDEVDDDTIGADWDEMQDWPEDQGDEELDDC